MLIKGKNLRGKKETSRGGPKVGRGDLRGGVLVRFLTLLQPKENIAAEQEQIVGQNKGGRKLMLLYWAFGLRGGNPTPGEG